ncbi:hypothetical protein [Cellulomonas edaphi]|uniref:Uncharacterized protein n=1 Tax=Cellulomonas edaphi TaxID=3053468 RepID=A0ABT7S673_9CELL|nr:hypothetical protein [Cellulomons edaphi]MDM7831115.1 hypothetical protein [Cellulomons edaphi]
MSTSVSSRTARRRLLTSLVALTLLVGLSTGIDARPAAAATPKYGIARVCFKAPYRSLGTTYWGPYNRAVNVDVVLDRHWHKVTATTPNTRGCLRMKLVAGYTWRFRVYHYEARTWYVGRSHRVKVKAGHTYRLRTVWLEALTSPA